jgi:acyl dehydratase
MSKDIPFDQLNIGDKFGPRPFDTSEKAVERFCNEMGDQNPLWLKASPWGGPVTPPLLSATLIGLGMIGSKYDSHATVPVKLIQKNIKPIFVGAKINQSGILIDKYIKKGLEYAVIESVLADENGNEYRKVVDHFLLSLERYNTPDTFGKTDVDSILPKTARGIVIPSFTRVAYQPALDDASRFLEDSSHRDDYAQTKGFKSALLSGYITSGYLCKYLVDYFGSNWLMGGEVSLRFVHAVYQREQITFKAQIPEGVERKFVTRLTLTFTIEKQDGTVVIIGMANGTL